MRGSLPHKHPIPPNAIKDEAAGAVTRRTVLTGAAAVTAAASVGTALDTPAGAQSVDVNSQEHMVLFVLLSSALTGIPPEKLAPGGFKLQSPNPPAPTPPIDLSKSISGFDPVDVKREYLTRANERCPAALEYLLQLARKNLNASNRDEAIIAALQFDDDDKTNRPADVDAKYLARSIVLMWYLGAWYEPAELKALRKDLPTDPARVPKFEVVSPKAYTQAWALRVAQAHPMGFSEMQFGYWTRPPNPRTDFI